MDIQQAMNVLNDGRWWNYLPDDMPDEIRDELCEAVECVEQHMPHNQVR